MNPNKAQTVAKAKRYVAYWERQPESREKGQEEYAVDLIKEVIALLQSKVVIDIETIEKMQVHSDDCHNIMVVPVSALSTAIQKNKT